MAAKRGYGLGILGLVLCFSCKAGRPLPPEHGASGGADAAIEDGTSEPDLTDTNGNLPEKGGEGTGTGAEADKDPLGENKQKDEPAPEIPAPKPDPDETDRGMEPPPLEPDVPALPKETLLRFPIRDGKSLAYVSNRDIGKAAQTVESVVIVVHGIDRNPDVYYKSMTAAVKAQGLDERTWVVAPFFMQAEDKPGTGDLRWEGGNWKEGSIAKDMSGVAWSSYALLDEMLKAFANPQRFSQLKKVHLVGFSAGGQFMQRYLVGTRAPDELKTLSFRFVVGAPGSFMYLTPERKVAGKSEFKKPQGCNGYDDFRYGIQKRYDYLMQSTAADMIARVVYRDVRFMAGKSDTSRGGVLDVSCAADLQGQNRYERAQIFQQYVKHLGAASKTKFYAVPNAAHEHEKVFKSAEGRAAIFGD